MHWIRLKELVEYWKYFDPTISFRKYVERYMQSIANLGYPGGFSLIGKKGLIKTYYKQ